MIISHIKLKNWRNFRDVDVPLTNRVFLAGPNASGKSNFLEVFRFLHDIVRTGGGLQQAIYERGGLFQRVQFFGSQAADGVQIEVQLSENEKEIPAWKYSMRIIQSLADSEPFLTHEKVWHKEKLVLNREMGETEKDPKLWSRTHLEYPETNKKFRDLADFFGEISYLHLVPQLLRHPEVFSGQKLPGDPYGRELLEQLEEATEEERKDNLRDIRQVLQKAVPQLKNIQYKQDENGRPHLEAVMRSFRSSKKGQCEDQFSDGTLRLIGLFWSLLMSKGLLLLEEPELSLNAAIIRALTPIIYRLQNRRNGVQQIMVSTHSWELLSDEGIGGEEVLLLIPGEKGTEVKPASGIREVKALLEGGFNVGEAIAPYTSPQQFDYPPLFMK